jgi:ribonuclease PH
MVKSDVAFAVPATTAACVALYLATKVILLLFAASSPALVSRVMLFDWVARGIAVMPSSS